MPGDVAGNTSHPPSFLSFPDLEEVPTSRASSADRKQRTKTEPHSAGPSRHRRHHRESSHERDGLPSSKKSKTKHDEKHRKKHRHHDVLPERPKERKFSEADDFIHEALHDKIKNSSSTSTSELGDALRKLCMEDRKGDEGNLRYGRSDSYSAPKFTRWGFGEVIGLQLGWKLLRGGKGEVAPNGKKRMLRYSSSKVASQTLSQPARKLVIAKHLAIEVPSLDDGFIALIRPKKDSTLTAEPNYRSITNDDPDDSDGTSSSTDHDDLSSSEDFTSGPNLVTEANARLEAAVRSNPTSVPDWINLWEHSAATAVKAEARSDIIVSIIQRAFSSHPSNKSNPVLRAKYLLAGANLWHPSALTEEWESTLKLTAHSTSSGSFDLWMDYLHRTLKSEGIMDLEAAVTRIRASLPTQATDWSCDAFKLRVLWRVCVGLAESGHTERAMAILQAQCEMVLFMPPELRGKPFSAQLDAFEEFWESECPRIGEVDAKGWAESLQVNANITTQSLSAGARDTQVATGVVDPYTRWALLENARENTGILPQRTSDADDDPYSTILFSDIRPFLFDFHIPHHEDHEDKQLQPLIIFVFLDFLGLHFPGLSRYLSSGPENTGHWDSVWSDTRFVRNPHLLSSSFTMPGGRGWTMVHGTAVAEESKPAAGWGVVKEWGWGTLSPLEGHGPMGDGRMWEGREVATLGPRTEIIRAVFQQTSVVVKSPFFDEHWLAFESAKNPKSAPKVSRTLLSNDRNSLYRWVSHARLERVRGKTLDARKIYATSLANQSISNGTPGVRRMFWDWAEMEWLDGDGEAALSVILRATGNGSGQLATGVLRARRKMDELLQASMKSLEQNPDGSPEEILELVSLANIAALLELLAKSDISSAMSKYALPKDSILPAPSRLEEALTMSSTRLLFHHTRTLRAPIPPSIFRSHVEQAMPKFINNTFILGMWLESERGESVWGRVRQTLNNTILKRTSDGIDVTRALWGVWQETRDKARCEVERMRSTLHRTISGDRSRSSPAAWRVAIELEITLGQWQRAKSLVYRAVGECPWAKTLYLLPFLEPLRTYFTKPEIAKWTALLAERNIRLRVPIDDLQEIQDSEEGSDDGDRGLQGDVELEALVEERRRLAPY
ncbi:hypothetical protein FRB99_006421 [Tulasnella sp. 403]|nr:hypothetical protein FRB99_006421 [Tulasnella sp. 403]